MFNKTKLKIALSSILYGALTVGASTASYAFVDLELTLMKTTPSTSLAAVNTIAGHKIRIKNLGNEKATSVQFKAYSGLDFYFTVGDGCSSGGNVKQGGCDLGDINPNQEIMASLTITMPSDEKRVQHLVGVTATNELQGGNNNLINNHLTVALQSYIKDGTSKWSLKAKRLALEEPNSPPLSEKKYCKLNPGSLVEDKIIITKTEEVSSKNMPIDYVFVLMLENRSFDSYFGQFPTYLKEVLKKNGQSDERVMPFISPLLSQGVDVPGIPENRLKEPYKSLAKTDLSLYDNPKRNAPYNPEHAGTAPINESEKHYWKHNSLAEQAKKVSITFPFGNPVTNTPWTNTVDIKGSGLCVSDTAHDWWSVHLQWNRGAMDGFYESNHNYWEGGSPNVGKPDKEKGTEPVLLDGERAMLYYDDRDIPFYYWLADKFAIGDRYFSSVLGPTWVNRDYLYGATSRGLTSNSSDYFFTPAADLLEYSPYEYAGKQTARPSIKANNYNNIEEALAAKNKKFQHWVNDESYFDGTPNPPRIGAWVATKSLFEGKRFAEFSTSLDFEEAANRGSMGWTGIHEHDSVPEVNFIDAKQLEDVNGEDEHPPGIPQKGQAFAYKVVKALMDHPEIWKRSVLFITYDEHGGFYDHVTPPPACEPDDYGTKTTAPIKFSGRYGGNWTALKQAEYKQVKNSCDLVFESTTCELAIRDFLPSDYKGDSSDSDYGGAFNRYGVRVPLMVVSPWVKKNGSNGYVSHEIYDHTSILRFIEARFGLPALTRRDANANPMLDFFDFKDSADKLESTGTYSNWGKEKLPTDVEGYPSQKNKKFSNNEIENPVVPPFCTNLFAPDLTKSIIDPYIGTYDLGASVYPARDWSDGIEPPASYKAEKVPGEGIGEANIRR